MLRRPIETTAFNQAAGGRASYSWVAFARIEGYPVLIGSTLFLPVFSKLSFPFQPISHDKPQSHRSKR